MVRKVSLVLAGISIAMLGVVGLVTPVAAHQEDQTGTATRQDAEAHKEEAKARVQGRLDEAKKKVCANRSEAIKKVMARAAEAGQKHLTVFSGIQNRVEEFYAKKQLNVSNYEALKAAAKAKYDAAAVAVKAVKDGITFDCNADSPVGLADAFKGKVKAMHAALKDYRSAVHALLVAVKTAASTTEGGQ